MTRISRDDITKAYETELELTKQLQECDKADSKYMNLHGKLFVNEADFFCFFRDEDSKLGHCINRIMMNMAEAGLSVSRFIKVCEVCGVEVTEEQK